MIVFLLGVTIVLLFVLLLFVLRKKNMHLWLPQYIESSIGKRAMWEEGKDTIHIMFCFVDHFEPQWNKPAYETEITRVAYWRKNYPKLAAKHRDIDGRFPQHTFFYPAEEYRKVHLNQLRELIDMNLGEVEIHLHHDNDTSRQLREKLTIFRDQLLNHGMLCHDNQGKIKYGFIHGNWALDNSRVDGRYCGVNDELLVLKETGCYADFTLPSAPSSTQTAKINSLYYAQDDPQRPKSHNSGFDVRMGGKSEGDLLIIQGPLALNWEERKWLLLPRIENGKISHSNPPTKTRINLWIKQHIHVKGKPDWVFVKVHCHGVQEQDCDVLFGQWTHEMFCYLENQYNDGTAYQLHYVTAREMYNIIKAAEAGESGPPGSYRDYVLRKNS